MRFSSATAAIKPMIVAALLFGVGGGSWSYSQEATPSVSVPATATEVTASAPAAAPNATPADTPQPAETGKPKVAAKPVLIPYQEQIYQVSVSVGVDPDAGISEHDQRHLVHRLKNLVESRIGAWWNCTIAQAPAGEPLNRAMLEHQTVENWKAVLESTPIEKKFSLTIDRVGTEYRISGTEWDRASQSLTSVQQRLTYDRRILADLSADLVFDLFRPLVSVDIPVDKTIEMRVRGGELMPPDATLIPYAVGDFVIPFARHLGKNRDLKRLQNIPWTLIRVDVSDRSYLKGTIVSAFATPISGSRRRVEMLGLKARPVHPQTRLQVIPRKNPDSPMAGYRVEILDRPETKEDKVTDRVTVRTDRNGEIVIPADPAKPLRYLIVYSGAAPLAKAPLIPGHTLKQVLEAPDDAPRLNVEAETELLQSELVDIVARREVLMARARGASKKAEWEKVTELEKQIDTLPTLEQFQTRIEALRNPAIQAAKRNKDKAQESRIARMCKQISEMATTHLDPLKVKEFKTEIEEDKKAQ